ncbi:FUT2 [Cordylochernes scorpioides]|uniref:L-Fucosyltransferase n=1 Tax=Cordylochernes scorpioides TaxID=51811 RepID=A0ABY6JZE7_9ARAC|nr:FUT2 [Cordylochernes scorpioides]
MVKGKEDNVHLDRLEPAYLLKESYPEDDDRGQQPGIQQDLQPSKSRTQKVHFEEPQRTCSVIKEDFLNLSIHCNHGRLGNQMESLAALLGLAQLNQRLPLAQDCNLRHLEPYFTIDVPRIPDLKPPPLFKYHHQIGTFLTDSDKNISEKKFYISGNPFPLSFSFYHHIRSTIRSQFTFKKHIVEYAKNFIEAIRKEVEVASTIIGIHVRGTDYGNYLKSKSRKARIVDMKYFDKAMNHFRTRYASTSRLYFVLVCDDMDFCREMFKDRKVGYAPSAPHGSYHMALLTMCDHIILSYGSFGYWAAYLSYGETVYFKDYLPPDSVVTHNQLLDYYKYLPEWIGISTTPMGYWDD